MACHRIPGGNSIRPILLKVKNTEVKSRIMRNRKAFREAKKGYRLSDDITKDNTELITTLTKYEEVEQAWLFNCNVYAKLKGLEDQRVMFEISDDIKRKINKRLSRGNKADELDGFDTESDSD